MKLAFVLYNFVPCVQQLRVINLMTCTIYAMKPLVTQSGHNNNIVNICSHRSLIFSVVLVLCDIIVTLE